MSGAFGWLILLGDSEYVVGHASDAYLEADVEVIGARLIFVPATKVSQFWERSFYGMVDGSSFKEVFGMKGRELYTIHDQMRLCEFDQTELMRCHPETERILIVSSGRDLL